MSIFSDWLLERGESLEFEQKSATELSALLRRFYGEVRTKTGKPYSRSSLIGLRSAIQRHLEGPPYNRTIDIIHDSEFKPANLVFTGRLKVNRADGNDVTRHKDPIEPGDVRKMYESKVLSNDNPQALQYKVFFEISLHFVRRGREGLRELKASSILFKRDDEGDEYATIGHNEKSKKDQGLKSAFIAKEPRMYANLDSSRCPLASLKKYISKLDPKSDVFFQQARTCSNVVSKDVWYNGRPMGEGTLSGLMPKISSEANLSKIYTNHCIRVTLITLLSNEGVDDTDIIAVSGHKNVQSLIPYKRKIGDEKRRSIGSKIHAMCNESENSAKENKAPAVTESQPATASSSATVAPNNLSYQATQEMKAMINTMNAQQVYFINMGKN